LLAVAVVLTIFAGHPESVVHVVALGGVLGLAEATAVPRRQWPAIAGWTAVAAALSLALSALYLLPLVESLQQTAEWLYRKSSTIATAASPIDVWRALVASVVPSILVEPPPGGAPPLVSPLASAYAGSVLWGPALYGLFRGRWRGRYVLAALGLTGVCAGARMPWIYPLLGRLPLLPPLAPRRGARPRRWVAARGWLVSPGPFAPAALAALGLEAWLRTA